MKQLDPKAVWLFFFSLILRWFFVMTFLIIWGIAILSGLSKSTNNGSDFSFGFLNWLWVIIPAFLVLCFVWAKFTYYFYRYELREDGFRKEHGVVWKKYVTIPYDRIQNIDIYRGIIARLLGISDLQIQTAGGITAGSHGSFSEGRLPGLSREIAEQLRDELIQRAHQAKNQGL